MAQHLGFLNVVLMDDAWDVFDGVEMENCLEVWRALNDTTQKIQAEILRLKDGALTPTWLLRGFY